MNKDQKVSAGHANLADHLENTNTLDKSQDGIRVDKNQAETLTFLADDFERAESNGRLLIKIKRWFEFDNACHRRNFIQTICVYLNFIVLGWNFGQLGTAFQDLQLVLQTNVKQTSQIFTMNSIGYMTGSLGIGFVYDRMDKLLLLGLVTIASAVTSAVVPWCTSYGVFLAVRVISGITCGGLNSGGNAQVATCWGTGGAQYMQALHFSFAFGGIISPLVTSLFMAPRIYTTNITNIIENVTNIWNNESYSKDSFLNYSTNVDVSSTLASDRSIVQYGETRIHIAFVITGILTALAGGWFLVLYRLGYEKVPPYYSQQEKQPQLHERKSKDIAINGQTKSKRHPDLSKYQTGIFVVVMSVSVIWYSAVECKFRSFLMPFILMQMHWTKPQCAYAFSLMWAFNGLGRFLGIPLSRFLTPFKLLIICMSSTLLFALLMYVGANFKIDILVWLTVPLSGLSTSVIFPSYIVWTDENVMPISGKMAGCFLFAGSVGYFIDPLYIGVLMENISPLYFVYLQIAEIALSMFVFVLLAMWIRHLKVYQKAPSVVD